MTEKEQNDAQEQDLLPLPDSMPDRSAPLPLPVRSTRYVVGGVLVAVILTVVTTTYLKIEQQIQLTMEGRLNAVLNENVHTITSWLREREHLTENLSQHLLQNPEVQSLLEDDVISASANAALNGTLGPLLVTDIIRGAYLLSPEGEQWWATAREEDEKNTSARLEPAIDKFHLKRAISDGHAIYLQRKNQGGRIVSLARLGSQLAPKGVLALSVDAAKMTAGLDAASLKKNRESYAFDRKGVIGAKAAASDRKRSGGSRAGIPPGAKQSDNWGKRKSNAGHSIDTYVGHSGKRVLGSWVWLPAYDLGIATEISHDDAYRSVALLRQSFLVLVTLVGAAVLGFIALGRWTLRVREESVLITRRLSRLARAIQPLSAALENDPSAVVLVDDTGKVVYANAESHRVLRVNSHLLGQTDDTIFENLHPELKAALVSGQDSIVAQGPDSEDETLLVSSRSLSIDGVPHYLYMLRPIAQQVRRQEVEHWKKLIRVLSHELNNALAPITSLLSSARTVNQMSHQDPRLGDIFESIAERTRHLITFLEGYRQVAQLPRPSRKNVDWQEFMAGLQSQIQFKLLGELPSKTGYFDPLQIERVLVNVLKNASEAESPIDQIQIEVIHGEDGVRINVMDRGTGMPEPVLKQAMLPFFSTKRTGTGVGLALSREIIEAHCGQLTLANREGGGLIVSCFLPDELMPPSRGSFAQAH